MESPLRVGVPRFPALCVDARGKAEKFNGQRTWPVLEVFNVPKLLTTWTAGQ